jgi:hypothetical protein
MFFGANDRLARFGIVLAIGSALLFPITFHLHIWMEGGRSGDRGLAALMFALVVNGIALAISLALRWIGAIVNPERGPLFGVILRELFYTVLIAALFVVVCILTGGM